jgi:hypothetical protein
VPLAGEVRVLGVDRLPLVVISLIRDHGIACLSLNYPAVAIVEPGRDLRLGAGCQEGAKSDRQGKSNNSRDPAKPPDPAKPLLDLTARTALVFRQRNGGEIQ